MKFLVRPLIYGLVATAGAFAAIAAALWGPAGLTLTSSAYIWLAVGSLLPGIIAFLLERRAIKERLDTGADRERSGRLLQNLDDQIKNASADRGNTARALSRLGEQIMLIISASDSERGSDVARFEQLLVNLLWYMLAKRLEEASPLRTMFLIRHGGSAIGQPDPQTTDDNLAPIIYHARSVWGSHDDQSYVIRQASSEEVFAKRLLLKEPGFDHGLLVEDVTGKSPEECPLLPTGDGIMSYCRMAVRDPVTQHGILCVDAWEPNALNKGDREVIGAFAAMLAVGLTLGRPYRTQGSGQPQDSVVPSSGNEGHDG
jgi:hypothetical protein